MIFGPIKFVLERLVDLAKYEAKILAVDEKEEIAGLQRELQLIESYFMDIDELERHQQVDYVLETKVQHLKQILTEIEDFLDELDNQKEQRKRQNPLKNALSPSSNSLIRKHGLVKKLTKLREKIADTLRRPEGYQLTNNSAPRARRRRAPTISSIIPDEIIIGLEKDVSDLVATFIGEEGKRGANSAIVGMGGTGKTTLAKKFYDHEEIKKAFPTRAWVYISQEWNIDALLLKICALLGIWLSESEKSIATVKLQEFLLKNSCLVVLDDVWERGALDELLPTLLSGKGRVLITTRNQRVVYFPKMPFHIHRARRLTPEESRELFFKIVRNIGIIPLEEDGDFAELGKEMLAKCDGLPLAIITLAGLLGSKSTIHDWASVLKDDVISRIMEDDDEAVKKVLELSYLDLSYSLKPCFLYLGTFKEDAEIDVDQLFNLWIDEGFVKPFQRRERRLKEVAKDCMDELVERCLVQVVSRDHGGSVEKFRIHDLIRDLCIDKAKELNFFQVIRPSTATPVVLNPPCHRAIICNSKSFVLANRRLRTLILIGEDCLKADGLHSDLLTYEMLKQVRVLSLEEVALGESAKHIGNMVLLRYLRFWNCTFKCKNADFLKKLRNLRSIIFNSPDHGVENLPDNMVSNMEELRVLFLPIERTEERNDPRLVNKILGVAKLRKLQTLHTRAGEWLVKELQTISSDLRELMLYHIRSQPQLDAIYGCISNLEFLMLHYDERGLGFDLRKMEGCCSLKWLFLNGKIIKHHDEPDRMLLFPPRLLSMTLIGSEIERHEEMNEAITKLNHLRELFLSQGSYIGDKLTITGLPELHTLQLDGLYNLKECRITQGSLPKLLDLSINKCNKLERIPDGISNIKTLQLLTVQFMPEEFCARLKRREEGSAKGGEDFHLVQHIPTVTFTNAWTENVRYMQTYRSY